MPDHDFPLTEARLGFTREVSWRRGPPSLRRFVVPRPREAGAAAVEVFPAAYADVTALASFDDDAGVLRRRHRAARPDRPA